MFISVVVVLLVLVLVVLVVVVLLLVVVVPAAALYAYIDTHILYIYSIITIIAVQWHGSSFVGFWAPARFSQAPQVCVSPGPTGQLSLLLPIAIIVVIVVVFMKESGRKDRNKIGLWDPMPQTLLLKEDPKTAAAFENRCDKKRRFLNHGLEITEFCCLGWGRVCWFIGLPEAQIREPLNLDS